MQKIPEPTLHHFLEPFSIQSLAIDEEERYVIFSTNINGSYNIWRKDLLENGSPYPLTAHNQASESLLVHTYKNQPAAFITSDQNGNEEMKIYALNPDGGDLLPIRAEENVRYFLNSISDDGKVLYYTSTHDNPHHLSIYSYNLEKEEEILLFKGDKGENHLLAVSPNEKDLVYFIRYNHSNKKIFFQSEGISHELIPGADEEYSVNGVCFANEKTIFFSTNYKEEFHYLASYCTVTRKFSRVAHIPREDILDLLYWEKEDKIILKTTRGPVDHIYLFGLEEKAFEKVESPVKVISSLTVSKKGTLYIHGSSPDAPPNIYRKAKNGEWEQILTNNTPAAAHETLINPDLITYSSFDGLEIEAIFYKALKEKANGYTIIYSHGGPQANEQIFYDGFFQYLVHLGFNIFAPNFRGTPNYGKTFMSLIEGDWGGNPRLDILSGIDWLIHGGHSDKDKLILLGGSFGGYMSLLLFSRHHELFAGCVDMFGPSNLFTLVETVPDHWRDRMDSWIGNPVRDRERLIEHSPLTYVDNMEKPLLIIQGANDPRVKKEESNQIYEALSSKGVQATYLLFEDEGHGFNKKENEYKAYQQAIEYMLQLTRVKNEM